ncbi:Ornithine aminotransferase [Glycine soja]|uniref:Ornithine aminotransferase n=1 Tax=Glycine soja TaxID=3848 RepID=A0A0B2R374_GLYSO|nr:Ornithine aminotransferase [Glycine soja]
MLACEWEEVRPDIVILGKASGGGVIPVSAVLADKDVMLCIQPGQHGRSAQMGEELAGQLLKIQQQYPDYVKEVRGRGLFIGVEFNSKNLFPVSGYELCKKLKYRGVLAKPTHDTIIRFTPPLCISPDFTEAKL